MKAFIRIMFLLAILNHSTSELHANNIMASAISWRCIGSDSFFIKLDVYTDCNGNVLLPIDLNINCINTGKLITAIKFYPGLPIDVTPGLNLSCTRCSDASCSFPYGIRRYSMQQLVNLSNAGSCCQIKLFWQQCCRNTSITTGAAGKNFYTEATINRCLSACDNSPTLSVSPYGILCKGSEYQFHFDPDDFEMDSFSFKLAPPLQASNDSINFTGNYSSVRPLYFDGFPDNNAEYPKGFHMDNENQGKILRFTPMKSEISAFSIIISEYRKGQLIAEARLETQYIINPCPVNHQPEIITANNIKAKTVCEDDTVIFNFTTNDSDLSDNLYINWNQSLPGAIWTTTNTSEKHPSATLKWKPGHFDVSQLPHTFAVTVKDDAYPFRGSVTKAYQITILPKPEAKIIITDSCCYTYWLLASRISENSLTYKWDGENFSLHPNTGPVTTVKFYPPGIFKFSLNITDQYGCTNHYHDSINSAILKATLPKDTAVCKNDIVNIKLKLYPMPHNYYLEWRSGNKIIQSDTGLNINIRVTSDTTIVAYASISKECTCEGASDTIHIKLLNCTSVNDPEVHQHIKIIPNPAFDMAVISTDDQDQNIKTVLIYNNLGILVRKYTNISAGNFTIFRESLLSGIYFISIQMQNGEMINIKLAWK